jgi:tRNA (guanosine-2'-O-)-methyltransferase
VRPIGPSSAGGAEICFNATDDNTNLLIDEGCDVRQGDVHFMIAWPEATVDVDLLVTDPSGSLAGVTAPSTLGLVLSDDCPRAGAACNGQAFESVHLDSEEIPAGTYHVRVVVQQQGLGSRPLLVRFGARLPGTSVAREIEFSRSAREIGFDFSVEGKHAVGSPRE